MEEKTVGKFLFEDIQIVVVSNNVVACRGCVVLDQELRRPVHPEEQLLEVAALLFRRRMVRNGKDIFNVHWPYSLGLIEGFCTVCRQPWVDLNPRPGLRQGCCRGCH